MSKKFLIALTNIAFLFAVPSVSQELRQAAVQSTIHKVTSWKRK